MIPFFRFSTAAALLLLAGACATVPSGPSRMALPGTGKSFDQFRADDYDCRQFANSQVGGSTPDQAATDSTVRSAVLGTAIGAAAGAAIEGSSHGAGVGAGVGLLAGTLAGSSAGYGSAYEVQRRYDTAYTQCMYAKGHKVPVYGRYESQQPRAAYTPPPPPPPPPPPR